MYAQQNEDDLIFNYITKKNDGLYVDIGAGDYKLISNTYMLYEMGWRGLIVEPEPVYANDWKIYRPKDILVTEAISDKKGVVNMAVSVMEGSWLYDIYINEHKFPVREVPCITFTELMERHPEFLNADLFSLDVELSEDKVLSTADFTKFKPTLIIIEKQIRGKDSRPNWQHLLLPFYTQVFENSGNAFYLRK